MFLLCVIVLLLIYYYSTRNHRYWKNKNVKCERPVPVFGTHYKNFFGFKSITQVADEIYNKYPNEKYVGYYRGNTPELIVRDPELIRHIMTVDFYSFYQRFGKILKNEPLFMNIFHVDGDNWRLLRQRLTAAFTTARLRAMFPLVVSCAEKMQVIAEDLSNREEYDVRELMARYTTEFIGACGFGIEMDSINNEHSEFRNLGRMIFNPDLLAIIRFALVEIFPDLGYYFKRGRKHLDKTMIDLFKKIKEQRNGKPSGRHDFIDLLLELSAKGKITGESIEAVSSDGKPKVSELELDDTCMAAQVFIFFAAGFETSSSATSFTLQQLAYNPEAQKKVQEEIDRVMLKHGNKLSYEAISEMTYLDMAFKEALRLFPSLGVLNRVCTKKYTLPGTDLTIDPGVKILIPVQALQRDEQHFENAMEFRPERFAKDNSRKQHNYTFLPFGEGPRACIGLRLGQMQSLAGLAALLHKFSVEPSVSSKRELQVHPLMNVVQNVKGVPLKIVKRK